MSRDRYLLSETGAVAAAATSRRRDSVATPEEMCSISDYRVSGARIATGDTFVVADDCGTPP